jgi:hypothetical protein
VLEAAEGDRGPPLVAVDCNKRVETRSISLLDAGYFTHKNRSRFSEIVNAPSIRQRFSFFCCIASVHMFDMERA